MKKILLFALVAVFAVACLVGCAPQAETPSESASASDAASPSASADESAAAASDDSLQKIKDKGEFIMGMDVSFPPMGFKDESGNITGFDVEMAQAVADHMGVKVVFQPIDWSSNIMELSSGTVDLLWNGFTITDERKEKLLMSEPYMENTQVVVVTADSPIKKLTDLAGKKLAVQDGSSAQIAIAENKELSDSIGEQVDFKDNVTALMDVKTGAVDALAVDSVVANYYLAKTPGEYVILEETLAPEEYGIGFRKGEESFMNAVMDALKEMKEDGTAAQISEKWFGKDVTTF